MTIPKTYSFIAGSGRADLPRASSAFTKCLTPCAAAIQLLLASSAWSVTIDAVIVTTPDNAGIGGAASEAVTLQNNGTLRNTATFSTARNFTLQLTSGTFDPNAATALTVSGVIDGAGGLTKAGAGTLIMTGANTYGGGTTVIEGTLQGNATSLQGNIVNFTTVVFNQTGTTGTYAGTLSGTGGVKFTGDGNAVLMTGVNSYQGGTVIDGGTVGITADANLGAAAGAVSISNNGSLSFSTNNFTSNRSLTFTGDANINLGNNTVTWAGDINGTGKLVQAGSSLGTLILTGNNSYNGIEIFTGTMEGNTASLHGAIALDGTNSTIRFNQAVNDTYAGAITGAGKFTKTGAGTLILTGANNYSGGTTVTAGMLQGDSTSLQGAIANNASVTFDQAAAGTYTGAMSGTGSLTKTGTGMLIMTGANTYGGGTTVTDGTLQGNASSLQGNIVNNGTVVFNQTLSTGLYAGTLSGTGGVKFTGDGAAVLVTGTNSYQGGTVIDGGTVSITADANLGAATGAVSISNNGSLSFSTNNFTSNRSLTFTGDANINLGNNTVTWAGGINGTGKLVQAGSSLGTLILTGNNSYNGIEIFTGTMEGNTTSLHGAIALDGTNSTIRFNQAVNDTYAGAITGAGKLTKTGAGTLILTGANNYSGGTTVTAGRLQGDSTSLQGAIANNASVTFDQATATPGTYSGAMSGTGSLTKTGTGMLIMTGANTYGGTTTVTAGTLKIDGSLAPTSVVNVANGAILSGTGSVGATNVAGGGTLSAGGAGTIGALALNGDYTPAAGSNLRVFFDAANASRVNVNGVVAGIDNATVQMRAANGAPVVPGGYTLNKQYTVLSSTGGITGALPFVDSDLTFLTFIPSFQNAGNDLAVTINAIAAGPVPPAPVPTGPLTPPSPLTTAFTQHALNDSQRAAAAALDANLSGMPAQALLATTGVTPGYALQSVSGHQYGVTSQIVQSRLQQLQQSVDRQQRCQDAGGTGTGTAGASGGIDGGGCQSIWAEAGGDSLRLQEDGASPGVRSTGNHFSLGVQHNFGDGWSGGLMLGRSNANADYGNALGDGKVTSTQIGAYARWGVDGRYVSASLVGGHERYSIHRDLRGSGTRASGEYGGSSLGASVEAGFTGSQLGEISVQPFFGLAMTQVKRDAVRETGAGNLNLNVAANSDTAITTQLGVRFGGSLGAGPGRWYVQPGWKHSFERASSHVDASFASDGSVAFGYDAARPKRDALALEAGLQGGIEKNVSWFASASVQTGNRAEALRLSGGLNAKW